MKKSIGMLSLVTLTLAQALVASAPSGAATTVTKVKSFGQASIAELVSVDGCIRTQIEVFANVSEVKGSPAPEKIAAVAVTRLNQCTNLLEVLGFGQTTDFSLVTEKSLSSSTLSVSLPISNILVGTSSLMTLNLDFAATPGRVQTVTSDKFEVEGVVFASKASVASRAAVATGTAVLGSEVILDSSTPSQTASINQARTQEGTRVTGQP